MPILRAATEVCSSIGILKIGVYLCPMNFEPLAQSVEHLTFNQVVVGSIPARLTRKFYGVAMLPMARNPFL